MNGDRLYQQQCSISFEMPKRDKNIVIFENLGNEIIFTYIYYKLDACAYLKF